MLRRIDLRGSATLGDVLPRAAFDVDAAVESIRPLVDDVRWRGLAAVREHTLRLDGVDVADPLVAPAALRDALGALDPAVRAALEEAISRTRRVHDAQRRDDVTVEVSPGLVVTERYRPVQRVGLYVPGGRVAYPSSVVMNVVPAQVAGVTSLAVASPPKQQYDGRPHPQILAACALLGVEEVYAVGGALAVALFAYGDASAGIDFVDLVTGPGNVYVSAAKRLLRGTVGIDGEAGPTEVAILADDTARADHVAADLVAQAEHDPLAACLLITTSVGLADAVDAVLAHLVPAAHHSETVSSALRGQSACVLVEDVAAAVRVADAWAPEHLEVITADAAAVARLVRNVGAVFVGAYAPVALGDYLAGSNHVLPTGGTARHTGGLSVDTFIRGVHEVSCSREALAAASGHIAALSAAEELPAHVAAVTARDDTA